MSEKKNKFITAFEDSTSPLSNSAKKKPVIFKGETIENCVFEIGGGQMQGVLHDADFRDTVIKSCIFKNITFANSNFDGASFEYVKFQSCIFDNCNFSRTEIIKSSLSAQIKRKINLSNTTIHDGKILFQNSDINISQSTIYNSHIVLNNPGTIDFSNTYIKDKSTLEIRYNKRDPVDSNFACSKIINSYIIESKFKYSLFDNSDLTDTEIIDCSFERCSFQDSILNGVELSNDVTFKSTNFKGALIDKYSLECITLEQIPNSSRVRMNCKDDVAELRLMYSGVYGLTNLIFLLVFIFPYCWFVLKMWGHAKFLLPSNTESITLIGALGRFIVSGGTSWQTTWEVSFLSCSLFLVAFLYNSSRFALLVKTISLEHRQKVRNLPVRFTLKTEKWNNIYWFNKKAFVFNILAVAIHTFLFFLQKVPTGVG